jgi:hypothetical protein
MNKDHPEMFEFYIGGFGGDCYTIKYHDEKLTYCPSGPGRYCSPDHIVEIVPTPSEWEQFWQKLTDLHVWEWKKRYDNPHVLDGTQWELKFEANGRKKKFSGSNEYPKSFDKFLEAVSVLVGGLPVQ